MAMMMAARFVCLAGDRHRLNRAVSARAGSSEFDVTDSFAGMDMDDVQCTISNSRRNCCNQEQFYDFNFSALIILALPADTIV